MSVPEVNWTDPAMPTRELNAIRARAETEAQDLLIGLAHYAYAQAATAHYGPEYAGRRAQLAELEAEREQAFAAWLEAKAETEAASTAFNRARAANDYDEQVAQRQAYANADRRAAALAKRLETLDNTLEPLRLEVQHAVAFLSGLRAIEQPVLPPWFVDAVRRALRGTGPLRL
jgi:hypothetical protein